MSERARAREGERRNDREIARDKERGRQRERERATAGHHSSRVSESVSE